MAAIDLSLGFSAPSVTRASRADAAVRWARVYWALLAAVGVVAFVLNVENRFTSTGLFFFTPPLDLVPPLSGAQWAQAYGAHQQDPVFAACGGSESLDEFKLLYLWNWFARAAGMLFAAASAIGFAAAVAVPRFRSALPRFAGLGLVAAIYLLASLVTGIAVANVADLGRYNVGQYRHAVDVLFATTALAILLVAFARPLPGETGPHTGRRWANRYGALFIAAILVEVAFGAMFAARNAGAVWTTLSYEGHPLPPLDQLLSFSPLWLNLTVNQYTLQIVHRALALALLLGALVWLLAALRRRSPRAKNALALLALLSAQAAAGIVTLVYGSPPWLSVAHQVGAAFLLAGAFLVLRFAWPAPDALHPREPVRSKA